MNDGTERIHHSGGITISERLQRMEDSQAKHAEKTEKWQADHQKQDDLFQDEIMASVNQRKGNWQVGNLLVVILSAIATACSIAAWLKH